MVAYNFMAQFADAVSSGKKRQTIRKERAGKSRHAQRGETIQLYTGMRTKAVRKLAEGRCTVSTYCAVRPSGVTLGNVEKHEDLDAFARMDGFADFAAMVAFFCPDGKEFIGRLIRWEIADA